MNKTDSIARRILGWKLNRWDRWFDFEKGIFIHESEFQPEENLSHAMRIVERLEELGYEYSTDGISEVRFNDVKETGNTLSQAITNAAYSLIMNHSVMDTSSVWRRMC